MSGKLEPVFSKNFECIAKIPAVKTYQSLSSFWLKILCKSTDFSFYDREVNVRSNIFFEFTDFCDITDFVSNYVNFTNFVNLKTYVNPNSNINVEESCGHALKSVFSLVFTLHILMKFVSKIYLLTVEAYFQMQSKPKNGI